MNIHFVIGIDRLTSLSVDVEETDSMQRVIEKIAKEANELFSDEKKQQLTKKSQVINASSVKIMINGKSIHTGNCQEFENFLQTQNQTVCDYFQRTGPIPILFDK